MNPSNIFLLSVSSILLCLTFFSPAKSQTVMLASNTAAPEHLYRQANASLDMGDSKRAIEIFEAVIKSFEAQGKTKELSEIYLGMALSLALNGYYPESIRYHKKALRAHRRFRSKESADEIMMNLGFAYKLAGKNRKANKILNHG